ncbi:unnamed protein product [marine sediment metagenome]|uniref:Uncharacterized protein n=1 Tax=marine sediment metagenome TaxID=412755 RepID=X0SIG3_9ZZZZ
METLNWMGAGSDYREQIVKICSCGIVYSLEDFRDLKYVGNQPFGYDDIESLELRNCTCESTISIALDKDGRYVELNEDGDRI